MMARLVLAALLLASAVRAEDAPLVVRQLAGVSLSASDSGFGLGAQLGIRISSVLLRVTLDAGGGGSRGYLASSLRGDWLHRIGEDTFLVAGIGIGGLAYGFIFDDPVGNVSVLTPEIGVLSGGNRLLGRILAGLTVFVPLGPVEHPRDSAGKAVTPPHVMATLLFSL
jgi:hypothetical protein